MLLLFVVLGAAAVTSAVVFRVQKVEVILADSDYVYLENKGAADTAVAKYKKDAEKVVKGKNIIFSVNRDRIKSAVEADPYIRVKKIEAKIPNKLEIIVEERYPMYHISHGGKSAALDIDLQIVKDVTVDNPETGFVKRFDLISITGGQFDLSNDFTQFKVGDNLTDFIASNTYRVRATTLVYMAKLFEGGMQYKEVDLCYLLQKIDFEAAQTPPGTMVIYLQDPFGLRGFISIEIRGFERMLEKKLPRAWECMEKETGYQQGIVIVEDNDNLTTMWLEPRS